MGKVIVVVLGLVAILAAAQYALKAAAPPPSLDVERSAPQSEPARRLQNVRNAAARIEGDAQRRADQSLPTE